MYNSNKEDVKQLLSCCINVFAFIDNVQRLRNALSVLMAAAIMTG
jgi:hypothetical protein